MLPDGPPTPAPPGISFSDLLTAANDLNGILTAFIPFLMVPVIMPLILRVFVTIAHRSLGGEKPKNDDKPKRQPRIALGDDGELVEVYDEQFEEES